jgi:uncharacterized membrane protein YfcA
MFIVIEMKSDILIAIFGLFIFISAIKALHQEKKEKEKREQYGLPDK